MYRDEMLEQEWLEELQAQQQTEQYEREQKRITDKVRGQVTKTGQIYVLTINSPETTMILKSSTADAIAREINGFPNLIEDNITGLDEAIKKELRLYNY